MKLTCFTLLLLTILTSCKLGTKADENRILLAEVGNKELFYDDISGPWTDANPTDSLTLLNSYVEHWVRRMIVLVNAEKSLSPDININKLVDDYRSSLLLHGYRSDIIEKKLDTVISLTDLKLFYDENKEQYHLSEPILKGSIIKIAEDSPQLKEFKKTWKKDELSLIMEYTRSNAAYALLDTSIWYGLNEFSTFLPQEKFPPNTINKAKSIQENVEGYEYFVKIHKYVGTKDAPPLSYLQDKLKKVIINRRKKELLERIESNLYKNALIDKKVKVYTN